MYLNRVVTMNPWMQFGQKETDKQAKKATWGEKQWNKHFVCRDH